MSTQRDPRQGSGGTYFVQGHDNMEEWLRVAIQDQIITRGMGGPLPEQPEPGRIQRVLDVGCGTGGWLIELASSSPSTFHFVGIDVNPQMIEYARTQTHVQQVSDRVEFHTMNALQMLEFPADSFDLVNLRLGMSWLRTWDWPKLLQEFQRVTRPGGTARITESEMLIKSNSSALTQLYEIALKAAYQAGHFFSPTSDGVTREVARLLQQQKWQEVQTHPYTLTFRAQTSEGQNFFEDMKRTFRIALPFYRKWGHVPDDYEALYQQALRDMQQESFVATWNLVTTWGVKPRASRKITPKPEI